MEHARRWAAVWWIGFGAAGCEVTLAPSCSADGQVVVDGHERDAAGAEAPPVSTPAGECPGPHRSGTTECFPGECGPGQYCDDRSGLAACRPGCTSDANCGSHDVCVRSGTSAVGRCEACSTQTRRATPTGCGAPDRRGVTPCFPGECAPGQYCVDAGLSHCEPGCTSDENCGPTERCERPEGSALGVCRSCDFLPS